MNCQTFSQKPRTRGKGQCYLNVQDHPNLEPVTWMSEAEAPNLASFQAEAQQAVFVL